MPLGYLMKAGEGRPKAFRSGPRSVISPMESPQLGQNRLRIAHRRGALGVRCEHDAYHLGHRMACLVRPRGRRRLCPVIKLGRSA